MEQKKWLTLILMKNGNCSNRDKKWYLDELSDEEFFDHRKGRRELYAHLVGLNLTPEKAMLARILRL